MYPDNLSLSEIEERHQLLAIANHAGINFYQDPHPHDFTLIAPYRSRKCPDCGLLMAAVESGLMCERCGLVEVRA